MYKNKFIYIFLAFVFNLASQCPSLNQVNKELINVVKSGLIKEVKELLDCGADVNYQDESAWTPLMYSNTTRMLDFLLKHGAKFDIVDIAKNSILVNFILGGRLSLANWMLKNVNNIKDIINLSNNYGITPLMAVASLQRYVNFKKLEEIANLLIEKGSNINQTSKGGNTALIIASRNNNYLVAKMLLDSMAKINLQNKKGNTALIEAISNGNYSLAMLLINYGAKLDIKNHKEESPLSLLPALDSINRLNIYSYAYLFIKLGGQVSEDLLNRLSKDNLKVAATLTKYLQSKDLNKKDSENREDIIKQIEEILSLDNTMNVLKYLNPKILIKLINLSIKENKIYDKLPEQFKNIVNLFKDIMYKNLKEEDENVFIKNIILGKENINADIKSIDQQLYNEILERLSNLYQLNKNFILKKMINGKLKEISVDIPKEVAAKIALEY